MATSNDMSDDWNSGACRDADKLKFCQRLRARNVDVSLFIFEIDVKPLNQKKK
ncbi:MAG TPA: hypothetical protein VFS63_09645 [Pseudolabrys sp.]|jgi:hypothetical protein|nr:hypothetical protein [Pseudolabrys sp.]